MRAPFWLIIITRHLLFRVPHINIRISKKNCHHKVMDVDKAGIQLLIASGCFYGATSSALNP